MNSDDLGEPVIGWPELQEEYGLGSGKWYITDKGWVFVPDKPVRFYVSKRRVQFELCWSGVPTDGE